MMEARYVSGRELVESNLFTYRELYAAARSGDIDLYTTDGSPVRFMKFDYADDFFEEAEDENIEDDVIDMARRFLKERIHIENSQLSGAIGRSLSGDNADSRAHDMLYALNVIRVASDKKIRELHRKGHGLLIDEASAMFLGETSDGYRDKFLSLLFSREDVPKLCGRFGAQAGGGKNEELLEAKSVRSYCRLLNALFMKYDIPRDAKKLEAMTQEAGYEVGWQTLGKILNLMKTFKPDQS